MKSSVILLIERNTKLKKQDIENLIEIPPDPKLGDYAFPCFILAKELKKSPVEIAISLKNKFTLSEDIEKVIAAGPYLNFFINKKHLAQDTLNNILKQNKNYGSQKISSEKVMIEFSQANTHKAFHIGHVRGTSLGESIARIMEFSGNKVIRANYQGDSGMHVAKWIWCYLTYHSKEKIREDETWLAGIYVEAVSKLTEDTELQKEVEEINRKLETKSSKKINLIWQKTRKISLNLFEKIYKELNTKFDNYFFESQFEERGKEIAKKLLKEKIAQVSDGATIIKLEDYGLGVWVLLRKDGTVLYSAKDLALAEEKFNKYKIEKSIYVVGSAQRLHVNQIFKTLELMNFKQAKKCEYIPVTDVRLPEGKMSSRTGSNILYSQFKDELTSYASQEITERVKLSNKELEKRALAISLASLKYSMLKQDVNKTITFDKREALRFEGNTGPYLLYSYARARSILRKAGYNPKKKYTIKEISEKEKSLVSLLANFPEVVSKAYDSLAPNIIANYTFELAQKFNEFYHAEKVIGSEKEDFLLSMVDAFSQVLKNSLYLLGISVLEQM